MEIEGLVICTIYNYNIENKLYIVWTVQKNLLRVSKVHRQTFLLPTSFNSDLILWTQVRENMEHCVLI